MENNKEKALINFKKAQSHINNIIKMIEDNTYCIDVMQQNLAVLGLLKSANQLLLEGHLDSCFTTAIKSNDTEKKKKMVDEVLRVVKYSNK